MELNSDVLEYNRKFGIITNNQIIIQKGQKKINFDTIKKINLIKYRIYYSNLFIFFLSICNFSLLYLDLKLSFINKLIIGGVAIILLIISILHEFYCYKILIKLNDNNFHSINSTQFHRACIKKFYYIITARLKDTKKANVIMD